MSGLTRRRFLSIAAASAALPAFATTPAMAEWRGRAMGAQVSMTLAGLDAQEAAPIFAAVEHELMRLEGIFSLYRTDSEITRLNLDGHLSAPSHELLQVLGLCDRLHRASNGLFDPSIQPLWMALAKGADTETLQEAASRVDWSALSYGTAQVRLQGKGCALTLNGVAQGYVTDRIAALLKANGLTDLLIDMGEIAAFGQPAADSMWRVGIADPKGQVVKRLHLGDRALATSAPMGTELGQGGHIFAPTGDQVTRQLASVSANSAAVADGLSTALCLVSPSQVAPMMQEFGDARIEHLI